MQIFLRFLLQVYWFVIFLSVVWGQWQDFSLCVNDFSSQYRRLDLITCRCEAQVITCFRHLSFHLCLFSDHQLLELYWAERWLYKEQNYQWDEEMSCFTDKMQRQGFWHETVWERCLSWNTQSASSLTELTEKSDSWFCEADVFSSLKPWSWTLFLKLKVFEETSVEQVTFIGFIFNASVCFISLGFCVWRLIRSHWTVCFLSHDVVSLWVHSV